MMDSGSVQRSPARRDGTSGTFNTHEILRKQRDRHRRFVLCSLAALVVSVAAWLTGVAPLMHLGLVVVGFLLGFLWPLPTSRAWAFSWIEGQTGYAYQTAHELNEREAQNDPYGLLDGVQQRARERLTGLELPSQQPWWLPVLALALGLAILPSAGLNLNFGSSGTPGVTEPAPDAPVSPAALPDDPAEEEDDEAQRTADDPLEETAESSEVQEEQQGSEAGQDRSAEDEEVPDDASEPGRQEVEQDAASEEETLSRFLDEVREQRSDTPTDPNTTPTDAEAPDNLEVGESQERPDEGTEPGDRQETTERRAAQGEQGEEGGESEDGTGETGDDRDAGDDSTERQDSNTGDSEAPEGNEDEAGEQGDTPAEEGEDGERQEGEQAGASRSAEGNETSPDEGVPDGEGEAGAGSGTEPAREQVPAELPSEETGPPELLPGTLGDGPRAQGGEIRLPGSAEGAQGPAGSSPEAFERAVERALTEGRIPVEYQEILRNYFR